MAKFSVCRIYKVTLWLNFSYNYSVNLLQILHLYIPSICDLETLNLGLALDLALPLSMGSGWHRKLYCHYGLPRANLRTHYTSQLELRTM